MSDMDKTPVEIAREIFPDWSDEDLDHVIWGRTGFPSFWGLRDGEKVEDCFRRQLAEYRDAAAALKPGERLCDHCNKTAMPDRWECEGCGAGLDAIRAQEALPKRRIA